MKWDYVAGLFDGEGSFSISLLKRPTERGVYYNVAIDAIIGAGEG